MILEGYTKLDLVNQRSFAVDVVENEGEKGRDASRHSRFPFFAAMSCCIP